MPGTCLLAGWLSVAQVKQLRLEREREKAMREQELELLQREKEAEHFKTWEEQEDSFHLRQAKLRCASPWPSTANYNLLFPWFCQEWCVDSGGRSLSSPVKSWSRVSLASLKEPEHSPGVGDPSTALLSHPGEGHLTLLSC